MNYYLLFKSLHLISTISWMAGLLYLPRLFVYHAETINNEEKKETFKLMEKRLFFFHHEPGYDFILVVRNSTNIFNWS